MLNEQTLRLELAELFGNDHNTKSKKTKLVLGGGGIKGIAHIGALKGLDECGMLKDIDTLAGSSVGAIIILLLLIGYSPDDLFHTIKMMDLGKLTDVNFNNFFTTFGLDSGERIIMTIEKFIANKKINPRITFKELYDITNKTLIITTCCLNDKTAHYFSHKNYPNVEVLLAIRMSISIPIYFSPVRFHNKTYVDGGCIDNFPIQLFDNCLDEFIAIYLSDVQTTTTDLTNMEDLLMSMIDCLIEGVTVNSIRGYEKYTIKISLKNISMTNFKIDQITKQQIFDTGYNEFLRLFTSKK